MLGMREIKGRFLMWKSHFVPYMRRWRRKAGRSTISRWLHCRQIVPGFECEDRDEKNVRKEEWKEDEKEKGENGNRAACGGSSHHNFLFPSSLLLVLLVNEWSLTFRSYSRVSSFISCFSPVIFKIIIITNNKLHSDHSFVFSTPLFIQKKWILLSSLSLSSYPISTTHKLQPHYTSNYRRKGRKKER